MKRTRHVVVTSQAADAARRGHPWIWRDAVVRGLGEVATGDDVQILRDGDEPVGRGVADPASPIALRVWTQGRAAIDARLLTERVGRAFAIRSRLFADGATTAYRLLHGEGDRCPGYVVDRYDTVAVLRIDGDAAAARVASVAPAIIDALGPLGVSTLVHRATVKRGTKQEATAPEILFGPPPPARIRVLEHGVPFMVDLERGQKTGAFLDQRENRRRVRDLASGRRVLNLFSYAGGFSLFAALGGATHVTSVDVAAGAHATAQESFRLAGVDPRAHAFVTADAFAFLADAKRRGERWDLVISDPPSFAPSERALGRALSAYRSLHRACVDVLADGGIFCAASCSSHVDATAFASTLDDAALEATSLRLLETYGPPADHPTLPAWPEGRYLKFAVLA